MLGDQIWPVTFLIVKKIYSIISRDHTNIKWI
jgi:hypothetical protein